MTYGKGGSITQTGNQGLRRGVVALVRLMWGTHPCDIIIDYWIHRKSPPFTQKICLFGEKRKEEKIRKEKSGIKRKKIEEKRKVRKTRCDSLSETHVDVRKTTMFGKKKKRDKVSVG